MMKFALILSFSLAVIQYVAAVCDACNDNGVACINEKQFRRCENGQGTNTTYSCSGDKICTELPQVCVSKTTPKAVKACGGTSDCGKCTGAGTVTCTSLTTFTLCFEDGLSDVRITCPANKICDISVAQTGKNPCVPSCRKPQIEYCDLYEAIAKPVVTTTKLPATAKEDSVSSDVTSTTPSASPTTLSPTTTTSTENLTTTDLPTTTAKKDSVSSDVTSTTPSASPTTPSPTTTTSKKNPTTNNLPTTTANPAAVFCSQQTAAGLYPYPNDTTCKKYINCAMRKGVMKSFPQTCNDDRYFNPATKTCNRKMPQGCI